MGNIVTFSALLATHNNNKSGLSTFHVWSSTIIIQFLEVKVKVQQQCDLLKDASLWKLLQTENESEWIYVGRWNWVEGKDSNKLKVFHTKFLCNSADFSKEQNGNAA